MLIICLSWLNTRADARGGGKCMRARIVGGVIVGWVIDGALVHFSFKKIPVFIMSS